MRLRYPSGFCPNEPGDEEAMPDAIVIGAGPNGLVAANVLADAGLSVTVFEAEAVAGGAVRTEELIEPGFRNDVFSAFYPLAVSSPAMLAMELERWGVRWRHGGLVLAHPTADGGCVGLSRDLDETAASLERYAAGDGEAWRDLMRFWARIEPAVLRGLATPMPPVRAGASLLVRLGPRGLVELARMALLPVRRFAEERFSGEGAALLLAGNALHADLTPESALGGFFGLVLAALGQRHGFPFPAGGAGSIADALVARADAGGVTIVRRAAVDGILVHHGRVVGVHTGGEDVHARRVLAAVSVWELDRLLARRPRRPVEPDPAVVKVDWTLEGTVPWSSAEAVRAPVVHLADSIDALTDYSAALAQGEEPQRPFVLFGQYAAADETRAPSGKETAWAYTHVPAAADAARVAGRMEDEVERRAPGFKALVRGRHVALLPPGRVNGGTAQLHNQLVFRGTGWGRPEAGVRGLYLASSSAHPGGGVHGAGGWNAARAALKLTPLSRPRRGGGRVGSRA
jgi:phytoene dehydrogenase-like protein